MKGVDCNIFRLKFFEIHSRSSILYLIIIEFYSKSRFKISNLLYRVNLTLFCVPSIISVKIELNLTLYGLNLTR